MHRFKVRCTATAPYPIIISRRIPCDFGGLVKSRKAIKDIYMEWLSETIEFTTSGKVMYMITSDIFAVIERWKIESGMCFIFLPHTGASFTLCENYDPRSRKDVENYYERAVPENQSWYQHTFEGPDDSPSHIRSTLTQSSISIPIDHGKLCLGTWQGIFLFEHRSNTQHRKISISCLRVS